MLRQFISRLRFMWNVSSMRISEFPNEKDLQMLYQTFATIRKDAGDTDPDAVLYLILANRNEKWVRRVAAHFAVIGITRSLCDIKASEPVQNEMIH